MIPSSRHDLAKSAKLGGAVLAVFACAAWRVCGAMTEVPPTQRKNVVAMGSDRPATAGLATKRTLPDRDSDLPPDQDPFRPFETAATPVDSAPEAAPSAAPLALSGSLSPLPAAYAAPVTSEQVSLRTIEPAAPTKPRLPMRLTGVVVADHPTAVIMIGDEEIVVRPGSVLPDGSTLIRVAPTNVTLLRNGQESVLWVAQ